MNKVRSTVKHMPRKAKLLTALLACVLVLTLIGVGIAAEANPTYIHPAIYAEDIPEEDCKEVTVRSGDLEFSRPQSEDYPFKGEYNSKDSEWWYEYWAWHKNEAKLTGKVEPIDTSANSYDCNKGILRITNTANESKMLSFGYDFSLTKGQGVTGSLQIANEGAITTSKTGQTFTANLPANGSIDIKMVFNDVDGWADYKNPPCATITITNIKTEAVSGQPLELCQPDDSAGGTYEAKKGNTTLTIGQTVNIDTASDETVTLTAQPQKGYKFYLWVDKEGKPLSTDKIFKVNGLDVNPGSVKPVFVPDNATAYYQIPGTGHLSGEYYYWDDAMKAAGYSDSKNVVLLADLKLENAQNRNSSEDPAKTFTIPSGVTLVVPYSDKLSTGKEDAVNTTHYVLDDKGNIRTDEKGNKITKTDDPAPTIAYRTLTVTEGYTLNVNGTLLVNALQGADNGTSYQSHIVGSYGKMVVGGTVTVNTGAKLYARGYVVDANHSSRIHNGQINVKSGGSLIQMMQITDWRGGNYTLAVYQQLMPITMYYLQNNMVNTTYAFGSTMRAQAVIAYQNIFNLPDKPYEAEMAEVRIITNATDKADSTPYMFVMKNGATIKTSYDYETDRLRFTLDKGTASMNALTISAGQLKIDTASNVLAVSDNMPITVETNATLETNYDLKFLPGAELTVNGTLNINEDSDLYFYGAKDYQADWSDNQFRTHIQPVGEIVKTDKNTPNTPNDDAKLNLNGTLNLSGTLSQSTNHSGLLANAGEKAKVIINQPQKGGKSVNESLNQGCTSSPTPTSDITYVKADKYYYAVNKGWASLRGITVDGGESAVAFDQGTYQVLDGKWYSHKITVNYTGISDPATKEVYTTKNECTFTAPKGYVITGIDTGKTGITAANADTADSTPISDGWKSVKLSNITAPEATLTATVKSYAHDVTWVRTTTEGGETKTTTTHSYLPSGTSEATLTFDGKVNIDASKVKIDDKAAGSRFTSTEESGKTVVKVTGITQNTKIEVPYSSSNTVTWVVTTDEGKSVTTKAQTVAGSATYSLGNTESENWKVVELDGVSIEKSSDSKAALKARTDKTEDITVTDVLQDITVNITVTTYKHKVTTNTTVYDADQKNADKSETIECFTNDATYTPTLTKIGQNDKYVVSAYTVTGGTLGSKGSATVCAILPDAVAIDMSKVTTKETKVDLTLQSYLYVWNWDATLDNGKKSTPPGFKYKEYLTDRRTEEQAHPNDYTETPYYLTLRDYGEAGKYYHHFDEFAYEGYFGIDYRSLGNNRFAISGTQKLPDYTGGMGSASLADGVLTESSWAGKIALKDEQVTVALVSYATKVTVKAGTDKLPEGIFYADANGKDVTTADDAADRKDIVYGQFAYGEEGYDAHRFVKSYTIGSENAPGTTVNDVGALLGNRFTSDSVKKFHGMTIPADTVKTAASSANGELTVSLTTEEFWQVYAVSEDNGGNYTYLMFVPQVSEDGPVPIYAPKAEKFNVSCTRQTDKGGNHLYYPTLTVKEGENSFFQSCTYRSATLDAGGKTLYIEGASDGPDVYTSMKMVRFTLTPYDSSLTWNVDSASGTTYVTKDGTAYCGLNSDKTQMQEDIRYSNGTWTYTVPTGQTVATDGLTSSGCDAVYEGGKVTVSGLTAKSTVSITTSAETSTDADTYYMGDMSFEYVRNAAAFTWDGKEGTTGSWKPVNSFGWRHAVGSKSYEVGDETLTVDNGSILFVNTMQNTPVTYTVQLSKNGTTDYGVSLMFDESDKTINVNEDGVATVTVPANSRVTLVCRMTGTPKFNGASEINIGTITVTKN